MTALESARTESSISSGSGKAPLNSSRLQPESAASESILGKVVAGVPTRRTPRTSPTIERSQRDSARDHPYNAGHSAGRIVCVMSKVCGASGANPAHGRVS